MSIRTIIVMIGALLLLVVEAKASVPNLINYQGRLTTPSGDPVSDGTYILTFSIWDDAISTSPSNRLWTSGFREVVVTDGLFEFILGDSVALPGDLFDTSTPLYIGIRVGTDSEITPRTQLVSVPYSRRARFSDTTSVALSAAQNSVDSTVIVSGSVSLGNLAQNGAQVGEAIIWNGTAWVPGNQPETDPQVGSNIVNKIPKWDGNALVEGSITDNGNIGIGTSSPASPLEVAGIVHSTSGGFKFPDGTIQMTGASVPGSILAGIATIPTGRDTVRVSNAALTANSVVCLTLRQDDPTAATLNHNHGIQIGPGSGNIELRYSTGTTLGFNKGIPSDPNHTTYTNNATAAAQRYWVETGVGFFKIHSGVAVTSPVSFSYICVIQ